MVNCGPLAVGIVSLVWGTPANFNGFRVLAALLHSQTAALNRGRHLYSAGRPSRRALAHISGLYLCRQGTLNSNQPTGVALESRRSDARLPDEDFLRPLPRRNDDRFFHVGADVPAHSARASWAGRRRVGYRSVGRRAWEARPGRPAPRRTQRRRTLDREGTIGGRRR